MLDSSASHASPGSPFGSPFGSHAKSFAFVVSGPSGVGKTSICKSVIDRDDRISPIVTTTTRAIRDGETDGVDYHFVSDTEYDALLASDAFLEHADVHSARYGATKAAFSEALVTADVVLLEVDVQGAKAWRDSLGSRCVTTFVLPPSLDELVKRLVGRRSEGAASLEVRTRNAKAEMAFAGTYDYVVVNHELDQATRDVESVIAAERNRPFRQSALLKSLGI
jgi:guanylate kinase